MMCKRSISHGKQTNDPTSDEQEHYLRITAATGAPYLRSPHSSPLSPQLFRAASTQLTFSFCSFYTHTRNQHFDARASPRCLNSSNVQTTAIDNFRSNDQKIYWDRSSTSSTLLLSSWGGGGGHGLPLAELKSRSLTSATSLFH